MFFRRCLFAVSIAVTLLTASALHESAAIAQQPEIRPQIVLTRDIITRFLAAYPELQALGEKHEKDAPRGSTAGKDPLDSLWGQLQNSNVRSKVEGIIKAHGFSSYVDWLGAARSLALAYGFAKSGKTPQELSGQADKALAEIRANPKLTAAQKQQMEALVMQQMGTLKHLQPPAGNIAIAKEMESEIAAVFDSKQR